MSRNQIWGGQLISRITFTFYPSIKTSINPWYRHQRNDIFLGLNLKIFNLQCLHYLISYLSVRGVITSLGVFPRYSCQYRNSASQIFAKQSPSVSSHLRHQLVVGCVRNHLCRSWDCHMKAKEDSILFRIILLTTSLEWTSIVQIVITFEFVIDLVNKDCPHFLSFSFWEWAKEESDEVVEHPDLLLVVVLEGALVALLQPPKWLGHLIGPGNLSSCQGNLDRLW